jgi:hypothetical protein
MEYSVFNTRVFFGTIAAAGVFAAGAAVPAMAAAPGHRPASHPKSAVTATKPVSDLGGLVNGALPNVSLPGGPPAAGPLGGLEGLPIVGPLLAGLLGGPISPGALTGGNPVSGILHNVTGAVPGLGNVVGTATNALNGVKTSLPAGGASGVLRSLPVVGSLTGNLPGVGSVTGALSGLTNAVPGLGSLTAPLLGG